VQRLVEQTLKASGLNVEGYYAIGDIVKGLAPAHVASAEEIDHPHPEGGRAENMHLNAICAGRTSPSHIYPEKS